MADVTMVHAPYTESEFEERFTDPDWVEMAMRLRDACEECGAPEGTTWLAHWITCPIMRWFVAKEYPFIDPDFLERMRSAGYLRFIENNREAG